jgi:hypothetical protein
MENALAPPSQGVRLSAGRAGASAGGWNGRCNGRVNTMSRQQKNQQARTQSVARRVEVIETTGIPLDEDAVLPLWQALPWVSQVPEAAADGAVVSFAATLRRVS